MGDTNLKKEEDNNQLRCVECKKVLAKNFLSGHFEIKCPRCSTINVVFKQVVIKKI